MFLNDVFESYLSNLCKHVHGSYLSNLCKHAHNGYKRLTHTLIMLTNASYALLVPCTVSSAEWPRSGLLLSMWLLRFSSVALISSCRETGPIRNDQYWTSKENNLDITDKVIQVIWFSHVVTMGQ